LLLVWRGNDQSISTCYLSGVAMTSPSLTIQLMSVAGIFVHAFGQNADT